MKVTSVLGGLKPILLKEVGNLRYPDKMRNGSREYFY